MICLNEHAAKDAQKQTVLVVDDETQLQRALIDYLAAHRIHAYGASNEAEAWRAMARHKPDLLLLDINLGNESGLNVLGSIREQSSIPVILMTGYLQDNSDRVIGLESGADDYLFKPLDMRELVARVRANLRRREMDRVASDWPSGKRYAFCGWLFDQRARTLVGPNSEAVGLTNREFALLSTFVSAPFRPFSRQQLLQATRVHDEIVDRSIDVLILRLRRKLEVDPHAPRLILTQRGVGYVFAAEVSIR